MSENKSYILRLSRLFFVSFKTSFAEKLSKKVDVSNKKKEAFVGDSTISSNDPWLNDSDASHHMTHTRDWCVKFQNFTKPVQVYVGNGASVEALGSGDIGIETFVNGKWQPALLHNVGTVYTANDEYAKKGIDLMLIHNV